MKRKAFLERSVLRIQEPVVQISALADELIDAMRLADRRKGSQHVPPRARGTHERAFHGVLERLLIGQT
jgi:hypothetical protein